MTVIAWDGHTLAADKRGTQGGLPRTMTKIVRHGAALLAVTGDWDVGSELRAWYVAGADPAAFPPRARDDHATLIVIARERIAVYVTGPYPTVIEDRRCAFGCGRDFAEAAMHLGHDAVRAVEVACALDINCGNGIDALTLEA